MIKMIVGLGNPTSEYALTRHNAGFWWVDELANQMGISWNFQKGFQAEMGLIRRRQGEMVWLCKPQTYMNRSGLSVMAAAQFYKITPEQILVIHDELDLTSGLIKLKQGGGNAGHNGLKSIQTQLGTGDFWRLRVGIDHPRALSMAQSVANYVLSPPNQDQLIAIHHCIDFSVRLFDDFANGQLATCQKVINGFRFDV